MKMYAGMEVELQNSWPRHLMEMSGELHASAALPRKKQTAVSIV
jgi:hypothetical protein